jgi:hypothetical protein
MFKRSGGCPPPFNFSIRFHYSSFSQLPSPSLFLLSCFTTPMRSSGAPVALRMHATHPDRRAMTGAQTPHRSASPSKRPPCVRCAPQEARGRDRYAQSGPASPACVETSCVSSDGNARLYGAPRGISGPGPCSPLSAPPSPRLRGIRNHPSEASLQASRGSLGSPSGIVRLSPHGHRYPGGAGLASLPARSLAASGTPRSRSALQERL